MSVIDHVCVNSVYRGSCQLHYFQSNFKIYVLILNSMVKFVEYVTKMKQYNVNDFAVL